MLTNTFYLAFRSCKCRIGPCICPLHAWWISRMTNFECLSCLLALPFGTVEMTNFECVLCSCSSVQLPLSFFSVMSRSRWRPSGWKQALQTHATNSLLHICLASFCHEGRSFSPLHEGLALCFVRHVFAHHSMLLFVYRLACSMCFTLGLLLSCSCSTSLDSAFLQRRAQRLFLPLRRRNHLGT